MIHPTRPVASHHSTAWIAPLDRIDNQHRLFDSAHKFGKMGAGVSFQMGIFGINNCIHLFGIGGVFGYVDLFRTKGMPIAIAWVSKDKDFCQSRERRKSIKIGAVVPSVNFVFFRHDSAKPKLAWLCSRCSVSCISDVLSVWNSMAVNNSMPTLDTESGLSIVPMFICRQTDNLWFKLIQRDREKEWLRRHFDAKIVWKTPSSPYLIWQVAFNWWKRCYFATQSL